MNATCRPTRPATTPTHDVTSHRGDGPSMVIDRDPFVQVPSEATAGSLQQDLTLDELQSVLRIAPSGAVYPYVVATVEAQPDGTLAHHGSGPNLQGGLITLCTCKHHMRSYGTIRSGTSVWIAGVTPAGTVRARSRHLFYLMRVGVRAASHAEMWRLLPEEARLAKSATSHVLGDVIEPLDDELRGPAAWDHENYVPPTPGHSHDGGTPPAWHRDIEVNFNGRRPALLVGDPEFSFVWNRPLIRLREGDGRLPRNPLSSPTLADFIERLAPQAGVR